jgi:hypothetical protein
MERKPRQDWKKGIKKLGIVVDGRCFATACGVL